MKKTVLLLAFIGLVTFAKAQNMVINEVLTSNTGLNADQFGEREDWIELYNGGNSAINLAGYALSDDSLLLQKWVFPSISVGTGQFLLVWASGNNLVANGAPFHTNFKLDSNGEKLYLSSPSAAVIDSVDIPELAENISYGRSPNGTGAFAFQQSVTPSASNPGTGFVGILKAPQFSSESGFFTTAFDLTLTSNAPDAIIIYTLDGSEPNINNLGGTTYSYRNQYRQKASQLDGPMLTDSFTSLSYSAPIAIADRTQQPNNISMISSTYHQTPTYFPSFKIFKGTVVKAQAVKPGAISSKVVTRNYFVTPLGANRFALPVVSVSVDEDKFWDYENGIYVAGRDFDTWRLTNTVDASGASDGNYRREVEVPGNFSYFENGVEVVNQKVGFQINGGWSRDRNIKALRVYARDEYSKNSLDHNFFDNGFDSFKRLLLRNSGNDCYLTYFRDAYIGRTVQHLGFNTMAYQPAVSFINGEYWGLINLRERYDRYYLNRVYGVAENEIDLLEKHGNLPLEGDNVHYVNMRNFIQNSNMAIASNMAYVNTQMDVENFTNYHIAEIFIGNADWPDNNIQYWRKRTASYTPDAPIGHDGRWRWLMYDTDGGFALNGADTSINTLEIALDPDGGWSTAILRGLMTNPTYKNYFLNRFADLLNTTFLSNRLVGILDTMQADIAPSMPEHIARWNPFANINSWKARVNTMRNFANVRQAIMQGQIQSQFALPGTYSVNLNVSGISHGYIHLNTMDIKPSTEGVAANAYPWSGTYFKGVPITVKAEPLFGYVFSHWSGSSNATTAELTLNPTDNINLIAHFLPDPNVAPEPIYFFVFDLDMPNNTPLLAHTPKFQRGGLQGSLEFHSALQGYPFTSADPSWRKASMERRNLPTDLNYRPTANNNIDFNLANVRGLQIKQPFVGNGGENTMIFHVPTTGFVQIKASFAAIDELAAEQLLVDYSVSATPQWITTGLAQSTFNLSAAYQLYNIDWTNIAGANNNANFKIRIRFAGNNLSADAGGRVSFNNFAIDAVPAPPSATQTITAPAVPNKIYTDAPFLLQATASSGLAVTYAILSGPATLLGNQVVITGVGPVQVKVSQAGDWQFLPAQDVIFSFNINKAPQNITFASIGAQVATNSPLILHAFASSGLPITYTVVSGPATLVDSTLSITGAGSVTISASQSGDMHYLAATNVLQTLEFAKASQTITFVGIPDQFVSSSPIFLQATSSSNLPITFTVLSGPATISDINKLTLTGGAGQVIIQATQAGNNFFEAAANVIQSFSVNKFSQTITFEEIPDQLVSTSTINLNATSDSGLPVSFTLVSGPATLDGNTLILNGTIGTVIIRAEQAGDNTFNAATPVEHSFGIGKLAQSLTFEPITDKFTTDSDFAITANATSMLPVEFVVVSGPISILNGIVSLDGVAGVATIRAIQIGNGTYSPADEKEHTFTIFKTAQTLNISPIATKFTTDPAFAITGTASSALGIVYTILSGPATLSNNNLVTLDGVPGTVSIVASQGGNDTYEAAADVVLSFEVVWSPQTITFPSVGDKFTIDAPFALQAAASSGLSILYEIVSGPALISADTITLEGIVGTVVVRATQSGDIQYQAAPPVEQSFEVVITPQSIDFQSITDKLTTDQPFALQAQATSGLAILYEVIAGPATLNATADSVVLDGVPGTVTIRASQNGNNQYAAAASVEHTFAVICADSDQDNDGLCLALDCDDTNPLIPGLPGTPCDDGNANTSNDQLAEDGCTCTGTSSAGEPTANASITVHPNPTTGNLHIRSSTPIRTLGMWSLDGRQLMQQSIGQNGSLYHDLSLETLPQGIYLLRVQVGQGETKVIKVVKN